MIDLPPMLGPVISSVLFRLDNLRLFFTNGSFDKCSTTACRPPSTSIISLLVSLGLHQSNSNALCAKFVKTSSLPKFLDVSNNFSNSESIFNAIPQSALSSFFVIARGV